MTLKQGSHMTLLSQMTGCLCTHTRNCQWFNLCSTMCSMTADNGNVLYQQRYFHIKGKEVRDTLYTQLLNISSVYRGRERSLYLFLEFQDKIMITTKLSEITSPSREIAPYTTSKNIFTHIFQNGIFNFDLFIYLFLRHNTSPSQAHLSFLCVTPVIEIILLKQKYS